LIVVEGPDNAGKSTLVHRLADDLKLVSVKNYTKPKDEREIVAFVEAMIELYAPHIPRFIPILDRFSLISEPVYGPLFRGKSVIDPRRSIAMLGALNPRIVYCRPPIDLILDFKTPQMEGVREKGRALVEAYDAFIAKIEDSGVPVLRFDYAYRMNPIQLDPYPVLLNTLRREIA
jgi:GTPase SAR1 family protein